MPQFPETRKSLLVRVRSGGDEGAWNDWVAIYRPVIYRLARKRGLQHADADDLAQRVIIAVQRSIGRWDDDPAKGRFRCWLAAIAHNAIINALTRRPRDLAAGGTAVFELLNKQPEPNRQTEEQLEYEYRRSLFRWAAERVRPEFGQETWNAFWLTSVDGMPVEQAGRTLRKSLGAVYAARSRVMRRLKQEIERCAVECGD